MSNVGAFQGHTYSLKPLTAAHVVNGNMGARAFLSVGALILGSGAYNKLLLPPPACEISVFLGQPDHEDTSSSRHRPLSVFALTNHGSSIRLQRIQKLFPAAAKYITTSDAWGAKHLWTSASIRG